MGIRLGQHIVMLSVFALVGCGPPKSALPSPPEELGLDGFYRKYVDADGIPVIASEWVEDEALHASRDVVLQMLQHRPDVRERMRRHQARLAVIGRGEVVSDLPEYRDLDELFPGTDWDRRARGLGGVIGRPLSSTSEENVLCLGGDVYEGESVLVHEFAHGMMNLGLMEEEPNFASTLQAAWERGQSTTWASTYAATNIDELWAEGAQSWFDTNLSAEPPNGTHNAVDTREELRAADPALTALLESSFGAGEWRYGCPE